MNVPEAARKVLEIFPHSHLSFDKYGQLTIQTGMMDDPNDQDWPELVPFIFPKENLSC